MNGMLLIAVGLVSLCGPLAAKSTAPRQDETWWKPVKDLIQDPCSPNPALTATGGLHEPIVDPFLDNGRTEPSGKNDCLPFNLSNFNALTREGEDIAGKLLKVKRARRWVRGRLSGIARTYRRQLKLCVPVRERTGLTRSQMQVTEDLIQLASFSHYMDLALTTIRGKKYGKIRQAVAQLSKKLKVTGCSLRPAVTKSTLIPYITSDDVPEDLRHKKRKRKGLVATYVIIENIETYLRHLSSTCRRNGLKICKN